MDELTKYRITGALIWLVLLIILVPSWYANPVDYEKTQPWLYSSLEDSVSPIGKTAAIVENQSSVSISNKPVEVSGTRSNKKLEHEVSTFSGHHVEAVTSPSTPSTQAKESTEPKKDQGSSMNLNDSMTTSETSETKEPVSPLKDKSPAWLVRVASYNSIESANRTLGVLEMRYTVTIGDFSTRTQKIYTVRVGPFSSLQQAEMVKVELDQELVTNSVIVQIR